MFEDIISFITYIITVFIQSDTLSKLFNKLPDVDTETIIDRRTRQTVLTGWIFWLNFSEEDLASNKEMTSLGIMGDVYDKTFDYDIYLKIYQYLTKPAENIRFSGDKEDRVPYIYTLYKQFTAELSNFKSEGV